MGITSVERSFGSIARRRLRRALCRYAPPLALLLAGTLCRGLRLPPPVLAQVYRTGSDTLVLRFSGQVRHPILSADGSTLACGVSLNREHRILPDHNFIPYQRVLVLWNTRTQRVTGICPYGPVRCLSADGQHAAVWTAEDELVVWHRGASLHCAAWPTGPPGTMAISPDGSLLALGIRNATFNLVVVLHTQTFRLVRTLGPIGGRGDGIDSIAFSPDATVVAAIATTRADEMGKGHPGFAAVWNVATGRRLQFLRNYDGWSEDCEIAGPATFLNPGLLLCGQGLADLRAARSRFRAVPGRCLGPADWEGRFFVLQPSWRGPVGLWDMRTRKRVHTWPGLRPRDSVYTLAYNTASDLLLCRTDEENEVALVKLGVARFMGRPRPSP